MLTAEKLRELLDYDPEVGVFTWRARDPATAYARTWNTKWAGKTAGGPKQGYVKIKIAGVFHNAHRLAWLHFYGEWPEGLLDHRDRDGANNRIGNLRPATHAQNIVNRAPKPNSVSGVRGVTWNKWAGRWQASIGVRGRCLFLGYFDDRDDAGAAFAAAAALHYGEFAPHFEDRSLLLGSSAMLPTG